MKGYRIIILCVIISLFISCNKDEVDSNKIKTVLEPTETNDANQISKDKTLDIVTWNLEWFGAPQKSRHAYSFDQQLEYVSNKIKEIDADIYAIQELVSDELNGDFLKPLVDKLNNGEDIWEGVLGPRYSFYFNSPSYDYPAQRVCYIYNKNTIINLDSYSLFSNIYNGYSTGTISGYTGTAKYFWASGRLPFKLKAEVSINNSTTEITFINIHAKCCRDSYTRRKADAEHLKLKLDEFYDEQNVVILGDYNDYVTGNSPYKKFYQNNNEDYKHVVGQRIDHISISNELYDEFDALKNNTKKYDVSISDHDPHMVRLWLKYKK